MRLILPLHGRQSHQCTAGMQPSQVHLDATTVRLADAVQQGLKLGVPSAEGKPRESVIAPQRG